MVRQLLEPGEIVLGRLAAQKVGYDKRHAQKNMLAPQSIQAIWVGQIARTGEHIVSKPNGDALRCMTI